MRAFYVLLLALVAAGSTKADLGEIDTFEVIDSTETTITLQWTITASDQNPIKYTVVEDAFISTDVQCGDVCQHKFEYLQPCTEHQFEVTAFYMVNGAPESTNPSQLTGSTKGAAPDAPTSLVSVDHNHNVDLTWVPPADVACLDHWQVCYRLKGTTNDTCETTNLESITLHGLDKCAEMVSSIRGVTPGGVYGKTLPGNFKMGYGDPSEVRDLVVGLVTNNTVELKWNNPLTNPKCVQKYSIDYGQSSRTKTLADASYDNHATISDLQGCTNYDFEVAPVSESEFQAAPVIVSAETLESAPLEITDIKVETDNSGSIIVNWTPNAEDNCQFTWKVCYHDETNPGDECFLTEGENGENYEIQINIEACTKYDVGVSGVSPSGLIGNFLYGSVRTWDAKPSAVQSLTVEQTDVNLIEISFMEPADNAKCVAGYDVATTDLSNGKSMKPHHSKSMNAHHDDYLTDLEACSEYEITVTAYTRTDGVVSDAVSVTASTKEGPVSGPREFGTHDNEVTETSIALVWYEPSDNHRCTGSYTLSWTGASDGSVEITEVSYQVIHTVTGLVCGGEYDFTLEVSSKDGQAGTDGPITYHTATLPC
ncbi:unnamed protein product [Meganyctiphanes norvegica]|uniref:Fibronectin type-III domain-containing protein n=1 Tax=Meganyctiphanes norvegica TaxID=48144 RepID=A0AAV2R0E0_MEGNR